MKKILFAVIGLMAMSSAAFAGTIGPNSTWAQINHSVYYAEFPQISFDNGVILPAWETCVAGDQIQSINAVSYCAQYVATGSEMAPTCAQWAKTVLSTPITKTVTEPLNNTSQMVSFQETTATSFMVPVLSPGDNEAGLQNVAFTKAFTIPACVVSTGTSH